MQLESQPSSETTEPTEFVLPGPRRVQLESRSLRAHSFPRTSHSAAWARSFCLSPSVLRAHSFCLDPSFCCLAPFILPGPVRPACCLVPSFCLVPFVGRRAGCNSSRALTGLLILRLLSVCPAAAGFCNGLRKIGMDAAGPDAVVDSGRRDVSCAFACEGVLTFAALLLTMMSVMSAAFAAASVAATRNLWCRDVVPMLVVINGLNLLLMSTAATCRLWWPDTILRRRHRSLRAIAHSFVVAILIFMLIVIGAPLGASSRDRDSAAQPGTAQEPDVDLCFHGQAWLHLASLSVSIVCHVVGLVLHPLVVHCCPRRSTEPDVIDRDPAVADRAYGEIRVGIIPASDVSRGLSDDELCALPAPFTMQSFAAPDNPILPSPNTSIAPTTPNVPRRHPTPVADGSARDAAPTTLIADGRPRNTAAATAIVHNPPRAAATTTMIDGTDESRRQHARSTQLTVASLADVCAICLEALDDGAALRSMTQCSHQFHDVCIVAWLRCKNQCPKCRRPALLRPDPFVLSPILR